MRRLRQISFVIPIRKFKILYFIGCCILSFICGSFFSLLSVDPAQSIIEICSKNIKRVIADDPNQCFGKWDENSDKFEKVVFLIIVILSAPNNIEQREVIRQTWLAQENSDSHHYFIIGTAGLNEQLNVTIKSEQKKFGDLMLLNYIDDSYKVLTRKVLLALQYVYRRVKFNFLLKVDDDSFVNLPQLFIELKEIPYSKQLYWGFFDGRAVPKTAGLWQESEWFICDRYLPYALGGGYILSSDLVKFIAINAKYLKLYNGEDVSIGAWLAPLDINRVHSPHFDTEYMSRGCNNKYIVTHKQNKLKMREKFNSLRTYGLLCRSEFKVRKSYIYNWKVRPSSCCTRNDSKIP